MTKLKLILSLATTLRTTAGLLHELARDEFFREADADCGSKRLLLYAKIGDIAAEARTLAEDAVTSAELLQELEEESLPPLAQAARERGAEVVSREPVPEAEP